MLDEEGRIVGGSDDGYLNKIKKIHSVNKRLSFKGPKGSGRTEQNEFWVSHYADHVKYDVTGFVDKNRDILQPDLETLMRSSKNGFISKTLFKIKEEEKTTETKKSSHRGKGTCIKKLQKESRCEKTVFFINQVFSLYIYISRISKNSLFQITSYICAPFV